MWALQGFGSAGFQGFCLTLFFVWGSFGEFTEGGRQPALPSVRPTRHHFASSKPSIEAIEPRDTQLNKHSFDNIIIPEHANTLCVCAGCAKPH